MEDGIEKIAEQITESLKSTFWNKDDIQKLSCSSVLALMAIPLKLEQKIPIVHLVKKWAHITRTEENLLAAIVQSLRISEVDFNLMYTIRTALFNYVTDFSIKETMILKILPDGKIELKLRETKQFNGDASAELTYVLSKLRQVTYNGITVFKTLAQYDFRRDTYIERSSQIVTQLSSFTVSGYKGAENVASNFGRSTIEYIDQSKSFKSYEHCLLPAIYAANTAWMTKRSFPNRPRQNKNNLAIVAPKHYKTFIKEAKSSSGYDSGYSDNSRQASPSSSTSTASFDFPVPRYAPISARA